MAAGCVLIIDTGGSGAGTTRVERVKHFVFNSEI